MWSKPFHCIPNRPWIFFNWVVSICCGNRKFSNLYNIWYLNMNSLHYKNIPNNVKAHIFTMRELFKCSLNCSTSLPAFRADWSNRWLAKQTKYMSITIYLHVTKSMPVRMQNCAGTVTSWSLKHTGLRSWARSKFVSIKALILTFSFKPFFFLPLVFFSTLLICYLNSISFSFIFPIYWITPLVFSFLFLIHWQLSPCVLPHFSCIGSYLVLFFTIF